MKSPFQRRGLAGAFKTACLASVGSMSLLSAGAAQAQEAAKPQDTGLGDIVITAQKRAQNLQDVPIAVTAIGEASLEANRVYSVNDLTGLAPGLAVKPAAGGLGIPQVSMRGLLSYGVVPGTEKEVALYIDGAYYGAPRGGIFDLADISRIEVLRGPQGTLFGRSATGGAISVFTPDPTGEFGFRQEITLGDYAQRRSKTRVELPEWNSFSGYITYVHDERDGDIKNEGAGTAWTFARGIPHEDSVQVASKTLGSKDLNSFLVAAQYAPNDQLKLVYKYDRSENEGTPQGNALVSTGPFFGPTLAGFGAANSPTTYPSGKRPKSVNNWFATPGHSINWGHNLTATYKINESLSIKNIFANHHSYVFALTQWDGAGGIRGPIPGSRILLNTLRGQGYTNNWSDELQINYNSDLLTLTAGLTYFQGKDQSGPPPGYEVNQSLSATGFVIGGVVPAPYAATPLRLTSINKSKSSAAYVQAEYHATPKLDIVGGYRITRDNKEGGVSNAAETAVPPRPFAFYGFNYEKTRPSYLLGVNYKPSGDMLLYAKYSTGFVTGGSVGAVPFEPETVESYEAGIKADWFNNRLRTNVAIYQADYENLQSAFGGAQVGRPELSTVVQNGGDARARGIELEASALLFEGMTAGVSVGYTDLEQTRQDPLLAVTAGGIKSLYGRPDVVGAIFADYETQPLFDDVRMRIRADGVYQSKVDNSLFVNPALSAGVLDNIPSYWIFNGRVSLGGIKLAGGEVEMSLWGKNLANEDAAQFTNNSPLVFVATSYIQARSLGVDLVFKY